VNTLISCAGRRTSLVAAFRSSAEQRRSFVVAADADRLAPALFLAHKGAVLPRVSDPAYTEVLVRLVREHHIRLLVPTIDTELELLGEARDTLREAECLPAISSGRFIAICADKWLTYQEFSKAGVRMPRSWLAADAGRINAGGELFVKPRDGSASQNTFVAAPGTLEHTLSRVPNPIIQERLIGQEITVDALTDFDGRILHYVPRLRIRTLGGESIQGVTLPDDEFRDWLMRVLDVCIDFGAAGPLTLQFFKTADGCVLSEINPRFGGGFPLALAAGADYPEWLMQIVEGRHLRPRIGEYRAGLYMTRSYHETIVSAPFPHGRADD
jgi:carbamoyl-phosphate synthase large subunit